MTILTLEHRIARLEAREEISDLCTAYCIACDDRDMTRLAGLFTPDVRILAKNGSMDANGIDEAIAMFNSMFSIRGPAFHWTHDRQVTFDDTDPDSATGLVLAHAETTPNGKVSIAGIRYNDIYRRVDGAWRFAERVLSFLYYMPMIEFVDRLQNPTRVITPDGWVDADFPETLDTWQRWHTEHAIG